MDLDPTDRIRLSVPAASSAVRIARAGAAGLATRAGFTYHEVEQVQLAVGEAAGLLAPDPEGEGTLDLTFDVEPDGLRIELHLADAGGANPPAPAAPRDGDIPSIAAAVLDAAVDSWLTADDGRRVVMFKRLSDTDDDED